LTPHLYRKNDPTCIEEKRSDIYTGRQIGPVYREMINPTRIQRERSHMYTGRDLTPYVYRREFSHLKLFVKEKTIKLVDWKSRKRNG
ncbi:hypothetical protein N9N71_03755, partial [Synechococcus sp. AH-229-G18]|nr:hypothetical protein [Synechococcus sp. AH-229-G18]